MEKKQLCKGCRKFKHIDQFEDEKKQCLYCRKKHNLKLYSVKSFIHGTKNDSSDLLPFGKTNENTLFSF